MSSVGRRSSAARIGVRASAAFLVAGSVASCLYVAGLAPAVELAAYAVVGLGSCLALVVGPALHRTRPRLPWALLTGACALFLAGSLVRPWAAAQTGLPMALADAFTVPGYLLLLTAFLLLLRARGSLERHAIADGLIVALGAGLLCTLFLALPAASVTGRPAWLSAVAALYPVFDVLLVLVLVNLAFTTAAHRRSYDLLVAAMVAMLAGDIGYAIIGAWGDLTGPAWLDLPFMAAYTLLGAAALHPSMVDLGKSLPKPVQEWSWRRLSVLVPALASPFVLVAAVAQPATPLRVAVSVTGAAMVAALLLRAVSAVHAYARAQAVFRHQATHDALTGLPNRVAVTEQVNGLLSGRRRDGAPVWVLFLDLDGFKLVNDSWGHDTGDRLLVAVGRRLREAVSGPAVVSRIGGDEFVVIATGSRDRAVTVAEQIISALAAPFDVYGTELVVTASIGLASASSAGTAETLLRDADTAMYRAKQEGRSRWVVFDVSMRQRVRDRVEIELALRHAVARRQLRIVYQPIADLVTGRQIGAEALLRWTHPVRGPVPPEEFIPVAEDTGLVVEIGEWVLTEAVRQLGAWRLAGIVHDDFFLSVNVSTRQLRDGRLADSIMAALRSCRLPARALALEITESVMLDQSDAVMQVLVALRDIGVGLSVDDFGTGYSALGYLRRFPVTGVKIDRAFVDGLGRDPDDEEIVRAIAAMSSALGLTVVAEGVETETQRDVLRATGVTQAQGWLFGRPVDPDTFAASCRALVPDELPAQLGLGNS